MGWAMGKSSRHAIGHSANTGEVVMHNSSLIISLVKEAAAVASCAELKQAAVVTLVIFETIQVYNNLIDLWL